jgi:hypothetical protein
VACPNCRQTFVASIPEVEDDCAEGEVPALKRRPQFARQGGGRRQQGGRIYSRDWRWIAAGVLCLVLVAAWFLAPRAQILRAVNRVIPVGDSADSILDEVVRHEREIESTLEAIRQADASHKDQAHRAAFDLLKSIHTRTDELYLRAVRLDPVSPEEYAALKKRHEERKSGVSANAALALIFELPKLDPSKLRALRNLDPNSKEVQDELSRPGDAQQGVELGFIESLVLVLSKQPPEPQNELEKILAQRAVIERETYKKLSHLDSASDLEKAVPLLKEQTQRLDELSEQAARVDNLARLRVFPAVAEFQHFEASLTSAQLALERILSARYGPNENFGKAFFAFGWAGTHSGTQR